MRTNCFHCGLPVEEKNSRVMEIGGSLKRFCCAGCEAVCASIHEAGLEGFYERAAKGASLAPPPSAGAENAEVYDLEEVQEEFVTDKGDAKEAWLLVEGISCAACVWLIERVMAETPGVVAAEVNLAGKKMRLEWNASEIKLSEIIRLLEKVGYAAVPYTAKSADEAMKKRQRQSLFRIGLAAFCAMNMMWVSIALWTGASRDEFRDFFHYVGFALATITLSFSGWPFFRGAWLGLRRRHLSMDLPIAIGALGTYLYSSYITFSGSSGGEVYFDTVVFFIFVILVGRHLEMSSRNKAADATIRLMELQPKSAQILRNGKEEMTSIRAVRAGDLAVVRPGERIPVDGVVVDGESHVDESILTGESRPVRKKIDDTVVAGSMNGDGAITVRVLSGVRETALARMARLIEDAQASRAPIQRVADRVVPYFVAGTVSLAGFTFSYWLAEGVETAIITATSVLIITCPCALGLAAPMAVAYAAGLGARRGILVKSGEALEKLAHVGHVVFDKTGVVTEGAMRVVSTRVVNGAGADRLLRMAAALELKSEHPVARGIVESARERGMDVSFGSCEDFASRPGYGVEGVVDGRKIAVGSLAYMDSLGVTVPRDLKAEAELSERDKGASCAFVAMDGVTRGFFGVADRLREDSRKTLERLKAGGVDVSILTGDTENAAQSISDALGGLKVRAGMTPEDKSSEIARMREGGALVAMVGDGVNDAPALMRADVGIAVGSGADVSVDSADIVISSDRLERVVQAFELSRATLRTIRQNIAMSIIYNLIMAPLAVMGYITPVVAAVAMPLSSLAVVYNATRIRID